jgi:lipopolysaccharide/colanic/teichoic acid biosynthesis glycosyltransferase
MQRFFDILLCTTALVVLSPFLIPVMILLRLTGEGEVFYAQTRVGLGGRPFRILKFATMLKDSPNIGTGTLTVKNDPRVLPFGHFLRRTKINELPQLLNVLKGDMSVIGPRPQAQRNFDTYAAEIQSEITSVRPGLSGLGAIVFRNEENIFNGIDDAGFYDRAVMPYKGQIELHQVRNAGIGLYFKLIFLTLLSGRIDPWAAIPNLPPPPEELRRLLS